MLIPKLNTYILLIVLFQFIQNAAGQNDYYADPVKIPIYLSGNFCELRPNHFHGGIDFKTQQRTGLPIYSAAEGHIYRIVVSPTGYGKAVYIEHPNGTSSVYAHLEKFRDDIEEYVQSEQYRRESFSVDLSPPRDLFRVERQEFIAWSGNSGNSGGPHLHFEIRDTPTQDALNPLLFNFNVKDNTPPRIYRVIIYPLSENGHVNYSGVKRKIPVTAAGNSYKLSPVQEIPVFGQIGIAVHANDFYDGSHNPCGIYYARMTVNGQETFSFNFDRMPFSDTRYMNSHIDYEESILSRIWVHRLWRQPGNRLRIYNSDKNRGIIHTEDGGRYHIEITLADLSGNQVNLAFTLRGDHREMNAQTPPHVRFFAYDEENYLRTPFFELFAPEGAFYDDIYFRYDVMPRSSTLFSKIHHVHSETEPVHLPVRIRLLAEDLPERLADRSFIGRISGNGSRSYIGGRLQNGWFEADVRSFGRYAVMTDTIPPRIVPISIRDRNTLTEKSRIRFTISDDLSGIRSYEGRLNGEWALFEYDPKNRLLMYHSDAGRFPPGKDYTLELRVTDNAGNTSLYEATFRK